MLSRSDTRLSKGPVCGRGTGWVRTGSNNRKLSSLVCNSVVSSLVIIKISALWLSTRRGGLWAGAGVRDRSKSVLEVYRGMVRLSKPWHRRFQLIQSSPIQSSPFQSSPLQSGLSHVGPDLSVVLDNSRESDDVNLRVSGFEVLPQVLRWQHLAGFVEPHVPKHTGTGSTVINKCKNNLNNLFRWLCTSFQVLTERA